MSYSRILPHELLHEVYNYLDIDSRLKFEKAMNWSPIRGKVRYNESQFRRLPFLYCESGYTNPTYYRYLLIDEWKKFYFLCYAPHPDQPGLYEKSLTMIFHDYEEHGSTTETPLFHDYIGVVSIKTYLKNYLKKIGNVLCYTKNVISFHNSILSYGFQKYILRKTYLQFPTSDHFEFSSTKDLVISVSAYIIWVLRLDFFN